MALFSPFRLGPLELPNRIVMAPLGRARAHVERREPTASVVTYYVQRASAGLIISEATHVAFDSVSRPGTAAIHTAGQVEAWRQVTDAVHAVGGRIFQQLFHLGRKADLGIDDVPFAIGSISLSRFDLFAAGTAGLLVLGLSLGASRSRLGLSLRAVADDSLAALSVGVRLPAIWRSVWALAGLVGLIAGLFWGARAGLQFSLSRVVLKAMPVLVIGGFDSIGGALLAGLIVGASEKLAEVYIGRLLGGGIENWFPYALAILSLLARPAGLFGERAIERV